EVVGDVESSSLDELDERLRTLAQRAERATEPRRIRRHGESRCGEKRRGETGQDVGRRLLHVLKVNPQELLRIKDRRRRADVLQREALDELATAEELLISMRPPETGQVVDQRVGEKPLLAILEHRGGAVSFRELRLVRTEDHRDVGEAG